MQDLFNFGLLVKEKKDKHGIPHSSKFFFVRNVREHLFAFHQFKIIICIKV